MANEIQKLIPSPQSSSSSRELPNGCPSTPPSDSDDYVVTTIEDHDAMHSTTAILNYCTKAILTPYHRVLAFLGWRPIATRYDDRLSLKIFSSTYLLFMVSVTAAGFLLQTCLCFRRDGVILHQRKLHTAVNAWNLTSQFKFEDYVACNSFSQMIGYVFPNLFPLVAFLYTLYLLRFSEYEQLHILVEKAFLQTHRSPNYYCIQAKLCRTLWSFLIGCIVWVIISSGSQIAHVICYIDYKNPKCPQTNTEHKCGFYIMLVMMLLINLLHDIMHVTILWSYGIQCNLLMSLVKNLCERIRDKVILQDAIKEIGEYYKFVKYLNEDMSISVAILVLYSAFMAVSGFIQLLQLKPEDRTNTMFIVPIVISMITWLISFAFPIIQATRLAGSCNSIKYLGHYVKCRPFGYRNTLRDDLDSFLLYTSTLSMKVKLFRVPINSGIVTLGLATCIFGLMIFIENISAHLD